MTKDPIILDQPWQIELARLQAMKHMLALQIKTGLMFRCNAVQVVKRELTKRGIKPKHKGMDVLLQLITVIEELERKAGIQ